MDGMGPAEAWYRNIPIVTKVVLTSSVLITLLVHVDVLLPQHLYLDFGEVIESGEWHRLFTNFLFFDYLGINLMFHLFFLYRHSMGLEESTRYRGQTADFAVMWLFLMTWLLAFDFMFYMTEVVKQVSFLAPALSFSVVYVWCRRNQEQMLSFLGLFVFRAVYFPYVLLLIAVVLQQSLVYDTLGLLVGHLYYYLDHVYPRLTGRHLLWTPQFLKTLLNSDPNQPVFVGEGRRIQENHQAATSPTFCKVFE